MPLVRIDLAQGTTKEFRKTIADVIYEAMVSAMGVPKDDQFEIIAQHQPENYLINPSYLGIERTQACATIQITLNEGRAVDQKRAFYKAVAEGLHERLKIRREDVLINLVEVHKENWSFGNGEAQYAKEG